MAQSSGKEIRVGILTVSDSCYEGRADDSSGPNLSTLSKQLIPAAVVSKAEIVPDEVKNIKEKLLEWTDREKLDLILTTGGTGFAPRDVTPEATKAILDKEAPGLTIAMMRYSLDVTKLAMLSRAAAGIRGNTLIVNFPGSKKGAEECFRFVLPALPHAVNVLRSDNQQVKATHNAMQTDSLSLKTFMRTSVEDILEEESESAEPVVCDDTQFSNPTEESRENIFVGAVNEKRKRTSVSASVFDNSPAKVSSTVSYYTAQELTDSNETPVPQIENSVQGPDCHITTHKTANSERVHTESVPQSSTVCYRTPRTRAQTKWFDSPNRTNFQNLRFSPATPPPHSSRIQENRYTVESSPITDSETEIVNDHSSPSKDNIVNSSSRIVRVHCSPKSPLTLTGPRILRKRVSVKNSRQTQTPLVKKKSRHELAQPTLLSQQSLQNFTDSPPQSDLKDSPSDLPEQERCSSPDSENSEGLSPGGDVTDVPGSEGCNTDEAFVVKPPPLKLLGSPLRFVTGQTIESRTLNERELSSAEGLCELSQTFSRINTANVSFSQQSQPGSMGGVDVTGQQPSQPGSMGGVDVTGQQPSQPGSMGLVDVAGQQPTSHSSLALGKQVFPGEQQSRAYVYEFGVCNEDNTADTVSSEKKRKVRNCNPKIHKAKAEGEVMFAKVGSETREFLNKHPQICGIYLNKGKREVKKDLVSLTRQKQAVDKGSYLRNGKVNEKNRFDDYFEYTEMGQSLLDQVSCQQARDRYVVNWYVWCPGLGNCLRKCGGYGSCEEGCPGKTYKQDRHNCSFMINFKLFLSNLTQWRVHITGSHVPMDSKRSWLLPVKNQRMTEEVRDLILTCAKKKTRTDEIQNLISLKQSLPLGAKAPSSIRINRFVRNKKRRRALETDTAQKDFDLAEDTCASTENLYENPSVSDVRDDGKDTAMLSSTESYIVVENPALHSNSQGPVSMVTGQNVFTLSQLPVMANNLLPVSVNTNSKPVHPIIQTVSMTQTPVVSHGNQTGQTQDGQEMMMFPSTFQDIMLTDQLNHVQPFNTQTLNQSDQTFQMINSDTGEYQIVYATCQPQQQIHLH